MILYILFVLLFVLSVSVLFYLFLYKKKQYMSDFLNSFFYLNIFATNNIIEIINKIQYKIIHSVGNTIFL